MGLEVGFVRMGILLERGRLYNVFQDTADIPVEVRLAEGTVSDGCQDPFLFGEVSRFHQIIPGLDSFRRIRLVPPVRHHDAVEAPFIAQDAGQQVIALLGILPVDLVVRRHDRPRLRFFDRNLEILEIEFPQGALADQGVIFITVGLLVVQGEMLDGSSDAIGLDAPYIGCAHLARKQRILGEILVIASVQWIPVQVLPGSQQYIYTILKHLIPNRFRRLLHKFEVPGRSQQRTDRESRRIVRIRVSFPCRIDAQSGRTVGQDGIRDAETLDLTGAPRCALHQVRNAGRNPAGRHRPATADAERNLFIQGHGFEHSVNVVRTESRLRPDLNGLYSQQQAHERRHYAQRKKAIPYHS